MRLLSKIKAVFMKALARSLAPHLYKDAYFVREREQKRAFTIPGVWPWALMQMRSPKLKQGMNKKRF